MLGTSDLLQSLTLVFNGSSSPEAFCSMILTRRLKFFIRVALELLEIHLVQGTVLRNPRRHFTKRLSYESDRR